MDKKKYICLGLLALLCISISYGTEYWKGEKGRIYLQLVQNGEIVSNATCFVSIFDMNASPIYENSPCLEKEGYGLYYFDFPTYLEEGVYMVSAKCYYEDGEEFLSPTSYELKEGSIVSGSLDQLLTIDGDSMRIKEDPTTDNLEVEFNFTLPSNLSGSYQEWTWWDLSWQYRKQISITCLLYTSPSPRDLSTSRMPSSA